jgi:acyl-[acyl-carrier-protein]-phospholipid O-acyltransferase/long-chain-fatty-acid--[acyl-carrier-protein] ligase
MKTMAHFDEPHALAAKTPLQQRRYRVRELTPVPTTNTNVATADSASPIEIPNAHWQKGFWSLIVTQFQGAFSDNTLKQLVIFTVLASVSKENGDTMVSVVNALFALPFILFSMTGGFLADRYSKRSVMTAVKVCEIGIMTFALAGFAMGHLTIQIASVFLMGVHSAIFGPSKYGSLPELLPEKKLSWGNGVLELGTYVAIITGMMLGGKLFDSFKGQQHFSGVVLIALAAVGLVTSLGVPKISAANPAKEWKPNPLGDLISQLGIIRKDRALWLALIGNAYFTFFGVFVTQNLMIYGDQVLHLTATNTSYLNAALAIGIGLGSFAAGYLSGEKIEYGLIPLGSVGMTITSALLSTHGLGFAGLFAGLASLGFFGGFFIVPVSALLQRRPNAQNKGGVLASANLTSFIGVFVAAGVYVFLRKLGLTVEAVFLAGAVMTLAVTVYTMKLLPDAFARFILWALTHTIYRIKVSGRENIPVRGGALLVCNHLSFVDALLVIASNERPIRFLMFQGIYERPYVKPIARMLGVIPISSAQRPRAMIQSLRAASQAIQNGELVCIFAEGQITRIGQMLPFRRGFSRIMEDVDAPIIPVCLDGVWGSIFSFAEGKFVWKWPRQVPYPVAVTFGAPLPPTSSPAQVRQAVQELQSEAWATRKSRMQTLPQAFIKSARHNWSRRAMTDSTGATATFADALARVIFMACRLKADWGDQKMVGILLPPSIPGALVNFAAMLAGKVPVNLNYTLSQEAIDSCVHQCGIKTVVSSISFLHRAKVSVPCKFLFLEEKLANPTRSEKFSAIIRAKCSSAASIERSLAGKITGLDDLATVVFSSGSTGEPKGVMLSHYNIQSNIQQLGQVVAPTHSDVFLGVLPFFHSFGFTATMALPPILGMGVVYHPNPLDGKGIGMLVEDHAVSYLLATPTFLQLYMRTCQPEQFGSLRFVLTAGEKLPERVATSFEEKFGIRPVEAYGCTECSPALTVNTHDFRAAGFRQVGAKRGKIGHPLPGVSVRIVDPETKQPLDVDQPGLLMVRGPNIFQGYLGKPEKTREVLHDGWYTTGDIAALDEDGFLQITDRLSRFSKIGGEMVPHVKIEEKLHEICGLVEQTFAVTGIPDDKKGERLVVLHTFKADLREHIEKLSDSGLPNLWAPKANQFYKIEALPLLGTGKLDLRRVREIATQMATRES